MISKKEAGIFGIQFTCKLLKLVSGSKPEYAPWNAEKPQCHFGFSAYAHERINILFSLLSFFFFLFYELNLYNQGFVYLEFVKYQLGLRRNMPVFAKCNVCIFAIVYNYIKIIKAYPNFLSVSNLIVYLSDSRVSKISILGPVLFLTANLLTG